MSAATSVEQPEPAVEDWRPGWCASGQLDALSLAWRWIASGETPPGCTPGSAIVVCPNEGAWDAAIEDLVVDMQRLLAVDRRRLLQDLRDEAATDGVESARGDEADR